MPSVKYRDMQLNDVCFFRPGHQFSSVAEIISYDNCYFSGIEQVAIFFKSLKTGLSDTSCVLDIDLDFDGVWEEIYSGIATVEGMNVIRIEHALYKKGHLRLRWTPDNVNPGELFVYGTGFPRGAVAPDFDQSKAGSIHT